MFLRKAFFGSKWREDGGETEHKSLPSNFLLPKRKEREPNGNVCIKSSKVSLRASAIPKPRFVLIDEKLREPPTLFADTVCFLRERMQKEIQL